jgi:hypothetical protein
VVFDGAHRRRQALCDVAVGQSVPDQYHDLALTVGQRQPLDGWAKDASAAAAVAATRSPIRSKSSDTDANSSPSAARKASA